MSAPSAVPPGGASREPSRDELLAMAYVDGELAEEAAREFEQRLRESPALGREVSELRGLALLARQVAPPEPVDYEWERLERDTVQRAGRRGGFALALVGTVGLLGWGGFELAVTPTIDPVPKCLLLALGGGLALVFLTVVRGRLRTLPFDPYTKVKR